MVSETILDSSFPQAQFRIEGYDPPFRYDRNSHGGDLFINNDIPTKIISITPWKDIEEIFVKLNFAKKNILFVVPITLIRILSQIIWIFSEQYYCRSWGRLSMILTAYKVWFLFLEIDVVRIIKNSHCLFGTWSVGEKNGLEGLKLGCWWNFLKGIMLYIIRSKI